MAFINVVIHTGLDFIFSHIGDEGLLNYCAAELLRYRKYIGAEHIRVFTDIKKKHRLVFLLWQANDII